MNFLDNHGRRCYFLFYLISIYCVANPTTYNLVGSIVGLDDYDNALWKIKIIYYTSTVS